MTGTEPAWMAHARESRRHFLAGQRARARLHVRMARDARARGARNVAAGHLNLAATFRRGGQEF